MGANNYVHPSSHPASMIAQDATHRFVSDTEKIHGMAKQVPLSYLLVQTDLHRKEMAMQATF